MPPKTRKRKGPTEQRLSQQVHTKRAKPHSSDSQSSVTPRVQPLVNSTVSSQEHAVLTTGDNLLSLSSPTVTASANVLPQVQAVPSVNNDQINALVDVLLINLQERGLLSVIRIHPRCISSKLNYLTIALFLAMLVLWELCLQQ